MSKANLVLVLWACLGAAAATEPPQEHIVRHTNLLTTLQTSPKVTCAGSIPDKAIVCVYQDWSGGRTRMNLFEITSFNAGDSWSKSKQITDDIGDEYDPFMAYDSARHTFWLSYSKWHDATGKHHNDVVIRNKRCSTCAWSGATVVAADGMHDYWIPSILTLRNGTILLFYTRDGPESDLGRGSGRIELRSSRDASKTWSTAIVPTSTCDAEYPRAIQNSKGTILMIFSKYIFESKPTSNEPCSDGIQSDYPYTDIHQLWSSDDGATWSNADLLYHAPRGSALHASISSESAGSDKSGSSCGWDILFVQPATEDGHYAVYRLQSSNEGRTWVEPTRLSDSSWVSPFNVDPIMFATSTGQMASYSSGYGIDAIYIKRINSQRQCS
ncbi:MAG: sialidase family protein [Steroidobacteraceae bacterium]|jgi:hypothetical protein